MCVITYSVSNTFGTVYFLSYRQSSRVFHEPFRFDFSSKHFFMFLWVTPFGVMSDFTLILELVNEKKKKQCTYVEGHFRTFWWLSHESKFIIMCDGKFIENRTCKRSKRLFFHTLNTDRPTGASTSKRTVFGESPHSWFSTV